MQPANQCIIFSIQQQGILTKHRKLNMNNQAATQLARRFLDHQDSQAFEELWDSTVNMVQPQKYFDPYGARDEEDFLQITRIGLYQALLSYEVGKGSTLLTWIRMRMEQVLTKEVRKIVRYNKKAQLTDEELLDPEDSNLMISQSHFQQKLSFENESYGDTILSVENLIYSELKQYGYYPDATEAWSEELYAQIVAVVYEQVAYNIPLAKCYSLKIAFPQISRHSIATIVGVSKPAVSHYYQLIREYITLAADRFSLRDPC